jgi:hypothetical protein
MGTCPSYAARRVPVSLVLSVRTDDVFPAMSQLASTSV